MGPFVPDIITDELNLIFGLLIGVAFGFVLEQAGFSSSRKLTALFYGRDFTVLRVFFTAAVTAMIGVILLGYFGLLDTEFIFINPTYLWAAIVGGAVMGVGFVVGGYCPGTSICAAAIGKIDAWVFVLGGVLGVFLFGEGFPLYDKFYNGSFLGDITVFNSLGMSQGLFALLLIAVAVGAFIATTKIEQRINPSSGSKVFPVRRHRIAGLAVVLAGVLLVFLPNRKEHLLAKVSNEAFVHTLAVKGMTSDELAFRILDHDPLLQIIDVRDAFSYARMTLPGAVNVPLDEMFGKQWRDVLSQDRKRKIFIANDEALGHKAAALAQTLGYANTHFLDGGLDEFKRTIISVQPPSVELTLDQRDTYRFRTKASVQIAASIKEQAAGPKKVVKLVKKVTGGCGA